MAIDIITLYKDSNLTDAVSEGDMSNPVTAYINGETGGTVEMKLYLKNTSSEYAITNLTVSVYDTDTTTPIPSGLHIEFAPDNGGVPDTYNTTATLPDVPAGGNIAFWMKVTVDAGTDIAKITDLKIKHEGEAYIP